MAPNSLSECHPLSTLHDVCASTRRYLIIMNFDPFLSSIMVNRWTYPIVLVVSSVKPMSCFRNGSI